MPFIYKLLLLHICRMQYIKPWTWLFRYVPSTPTTTHVYGYGEWPTYKKTLHAASSQFRLNKIKTIVPSDEWMCGLEVHKTSSSDSSHIPRTHNLHILLITSGSGYDIIHVILRRCDGFARIFVTKSYALFCASSGALWSRCGKHTHQHDFIIVVNDG